MGYVTFSLGTPLNSMSPSSLSIQTRTLGYCKPRSNCSFVHQSTAQQGVKLKTSSETTEKASGCLDRRSATSVAFFEIPSASPSLIEAVTVTTATDAHSEIKTMLDIIINTGSFLLSPFLFPFVFDIFL